MDQQCNAIVKHWTMSNVQNAQITIDQSLDQCQSWVCQLP